MKVFFFKAFVAACYFLYLAALFAPAAADRHAGFSCVHSSSGIPAVWIQPWSHQCPAEGCT